MKELDKEEEPPFQELKKKICYYIPTMKFQIWIEELDLGSSRWTETASVLSVKFPSFFLKVLKNLSAGMFTWISRSRVWTSAMAPQFFGFLTMTLVLSVLIFYQIREKRVGFLLSLLISTTTRGADKKIIVIFFLIKKLVYTQLNLRNPSILLFSVLVEKPVWETMDWSAIDLKYLTFCSPFYIWSREKKVELSIKR